MKATIGVDRTEQLVEKKEINNRASVFPLGKPLVTGRPAFKPSNKQRTPQKPTERDGSIFDFLSFWGPTKDKQNNKPRRPLGALPAPPQSRPVKDVPPAQDLQRKLCLAGKMIIHIPRNPRGQALLVLRFGPSHQKLALLFEGITGRDITVPSLDRSQ